MRSSRGLNPPFGNADDIKHIMHAWKMLKPGGRLVAICANGPRQNHPSLLSGGTHPGKDSIGISLCELRPMKVQVTLTRTDTGANTNIRSDSGESSKDYSSWEDALTEAEHIGFINTVESMAARALPPGLPLHTRAEVDSSVFSSQGFVAGKRLPPQ
jgi:hypothetical protein